MVLRKFQDLFRDLKSRKFAVDSLFTYASTVVLAISGIALNILVGNSYQAEGLGIFNQAVTLFMLVSMITVLGLQTSVVKFVAEHHENLGERSKIISASLLLAFPISVVAVMLNEWVTALYPRWLFNFEVTQATRIFMWGIPFFTFNKVLLAILNGLREMRTYSAVQTARWLLILLGVALLCFSGSPRDYLFGVIPAVEVVILVILHILTRHLYQFSLQGLKPWVKEHLSFGGKNLFISILSETNSQVDIFLISFFLSNADVGVYSFASTLAKGLLMFSGAVQLNINPVISSLWAKNQKEELQTYILKVAKTMWLIIIPMFLAVAAGYPIFTYLFVHGSEFEHSATIFYILLAGALLPSVYYFAGAFFSMANRVNFSVVLICSMLAFNAITAMVLIPLWGIVGAAIATSLTYVFSVLMLQWLLSSVLGVRLVGKNL